MLVIPTSNIKILRCPLELDNDNQINFANANDQYAYFNNLPKIEEFDYTYVRRDNNLRVQTNDNLTYETLLTYNYVMYQNEGFSNKWFYAHITSYTWVNSELTILTIEEDFFQSWQFDIVYGNSFIEREHVTDDTIGAHTIKEGLEKGEYVVIEHYKDPHLTDFKLVVASTESPSGEGAMYGATYNGIYSGVRYYTYDATNMSANLDYLAGRGKIDAVSSLFLAPDFLIPQSGGGPVDDSDEVATYGIGITPITALNGYTPKNNKLLTYPYCYLLGSNANGSSAIYKQELFSQNALGQYVFTIIGSLTPGCSIRMIPRSYNGDLLNQDEGLNLGKYPQLNWATDMFTNWVTQNGVNVATSLIGSGAVTIASIESGNVAGALAGASGIAKNLNEISKAHLIPPQARGNLNCGDVITSSHDNTFHICKMTIKQEYAKIIDDYFEHYGYKVNTFKTLSITGRPFWNYVKTTMCNLEGNIPSEAMQKLKEMFNHGVTIWHNPANFLNYSLNNH